MTAFDKWFSVVVGVEGDRLSLDPNDPGNYTPEGVLKGSQYGVSARSYPNVNFPITRDAAATIARRDYWNAHALDTLPPAFAFLMADAYYNGADNPVKWLQSAVGTEEDGILGPVTIAAAERAIAGPTAATALGEFAAKHLAYHALLDRPADELGWARRDVTMLIEAIALAGGIAAETVTR